MRVDAFSYELPDELIAQRPSDEREDARLLLVGNPLRHHRVADLAELTPPGSLVVVNDTRVIPARLLGHKPSGGRTELLLVKRTGPGTVDVAGTPTPVEVWEAMGRSSKPLRSGTEVAIRPRGDAGAPVAMVARIVRRMADGLLEVALRATGERTVDEAIRACGHVPLPPYIRRGDEEGDAVRYQTVYARSEGAVAAPTAGLHLTQALLDRLRSRGCEIAAVTLHVGPGTFLPVEAEDLDLHPMHAERFAVPPATVDAVARARGRGDPVVAIGTTTVRALETAADRHRPGHVCAHEGDTRLLIQPGYSWGVVDGLLTNFHLPRSTLLAMVCAFGGTDRVLSAYRSAVAERYRFYSYGDAMFLWRRA